MKEKRISVEVNENFVNSLFMKLKKYRDSSNLGLASRVIVNISKEELDFVVHVLDKLNTK